MSYKAFPLLLFSGGEFKELVSIFFSFLAGHAFFSDPSGADER